VKVWLSKRLTFSRIVDLFSVTSDRARLVEESEAYSHFISGGMTNSLARLDNGLQFAYKHTIVHTGVQWKEINNGQEEIDQEAQKGQEARGDQAPCCRRIPDA